MHDHAVSTAPGADAVAAAVHRACVLEASAPKPGNVSPGRPFRDMRYEDFLASASAIRPVFRDAGTRPLGETILGAIRATRGVTAANTNLGIVLLLAPLARAALRHAGMPLRDAARRVVAESTVADASLAYEAIRLAAPGGLGQVSSEDVSQSPAVSLAGAMQLAAGRDAVASEWATGFRATFEVGAPALAHALDAGLTWDAATTWAFVTLLAHQPDTLIARKLGPAVAERVQAEARGLLEVPRGTPAWAAALDALDRTLRDDANRRNPGATADLTAAALFVVIIGREIRPE